MKLSPEEVKKIAHLARLSISDDEVKKFGGQLSSILEYIEKLNELDTDQVEPTAYTSTQGTPMREDEAVASQARELILEHAPDREDTLFKVPKVIT